MGFQKIYASVVSFQFIAILELAVDVLSLYCVQNMYL